MSQSFDKVESFLSSNQYNDSNDAKNSQGQAVIFESAQKRGKKSMYYNNRLSNQDDINEFNKSPNSSYANQKSPVLKYATELDSDNVIINNFQVNSAQNSLRSIHLKMHPNLSQDESIKQLSQKEQSKDFQDTQTSSNTPLGSPKITNQNLEYLYRQQFLKRQTNWQDEIDVMQYKPHQIHQKIDNIQAFDQNLENKEAIETLKLILSKNPGKRNSKEIHFVRKCLKNVKFFSDIEKQLPEDLILRLCKFLNYERYPQFHRLYKAGDFGRKFYIILDGSVLILTPSISKTFDKSVTDNKEDRQIKQMIMNECEETPKPMFQLQTFEESISEDVFIQQVVQQQNEGFNIKKTLDKGDGFGEIALRTEGIRTASVVCKEDSHFVSITASTYNEIIEAYHDMIYKEKLDFLKNVSIFKKWSLSFVHEIMMQVTIKQYKRGDVLYDEGDNSKDLYFVRSGEVEQVVEVKDQQNNNNSIIPDKLMKSNLIWNEKAKNSKLKKCSLVILGPYQYFGDYEIFKKSKRITKAVCYSNSELFVLDKKEFFENMQFINMVKEIYNLFKEREKWYQGIIKKNIATETQINKKITNQKRIQSQQYQHEDYQQEGEKSRKQEDGKNKEENFSSQFYDSINIYKDTKSSKQQNQELFSDQIRMRNKSEYQQNKKREQETELQNVMKLKQFVGKSMNLIQQIETAKNTSFPKQSFYQRKSELVIPSLNNQDTTIPSFSTFDDLHQNQQQKDLTSNQNMQQNNKQLPKQKINLPIKNLSSKSIQSLPLVKDAISPNSNRNIQSQRQSVYINSQSETQKQLSNLISPQNILKSKNIFSFNNQPQLENTTPASRNQSSSLYQLKSPSHKVISQQQQKNTKSSIFSVRGSLEDIDGMVHELEKNVQQKKNNQGSEDNLQFIKSQIEVNQRNLHRLKNEQGFTHKYLCEKTGRYKIPLSTQQLSNHDIDFEYNVQTATSMLHISDKLQPSHRDFKNKINASIQIGNTSQSLQTDTHLDQTDTQKRNEAYTQTSTSRLDSILPAIVSPKLMQKELNFSKCYKKAKKIREIHDESNQKRTLQFF